MDRRTSGQWLRLLTVAALLCGSIAFAWWAFPLVYPFLLAWLLAYVLNPLVDGLQRNVRLPRWLAATLILLLFAAAMLTIASALVMRLAEEIMNLSGSLQHLVDWTERTVDAVLSRPDIRDLIARINAFYQNNPDYQDTINRRISDTAGALTQAATNLISVFLNGVVGVLASLPQVATIAVVILLASFFISKDWYRHLARFGRWFPEPVRKRAGTVWHNLQQALFGYVRAQFIMISITTFVVIVGLFILGVPNAFSVGLLIGFVDLLPYLGVGFAMIPWIAYAFLTGDWPLGTGLSVLYGVVLVARQILEPKVLATSVGLEPLPTLIAMFVGLKLFGFLGLIIGPVTIVLLAACHRANVFRDLWFYIVYGRSPRT